MPLKLLIGWIVLGLVVAITFGMLVSAGRKRRR